MFIGRAIYRGLLQRKPSLKDSVKKGISVWAGGGPTKALHAVIREDEFSVMVLPELIAAATSHWNGRYIFFLHVPKTAGTSFRLALNDAIGAPAIMVYGRRCDVDKDDLAKYSFWPYLAGHAHLDKFPTTHRGVTTLREPRARLLSQFRQAQNQFLGPHAHLNKEGRRRQSANDAISMPFELWLRKYGEPQINFFVDSTSGNSSGDARTAIALRDLSATSPDVRSSLSKALKRFDACAWSHDHQGLELAIQRMTGRHSVSISRANEFQSSRYSKPVKLNSEARLLLDELGRADQVLFDMAHDVLGLPKLSTSKADELFERTADRLDFTL